MNKLYALLLLFFLAVAPPLSSAQTWKPLGTDEVNNTSFGFTAHNIIAIAPDGTPYVAFTDNANNSTITIKRFDGKKWVQAGISFTEGYYSSGVSLAFGVDGTPYIAYMPSFADQHIATISVRKLVGDNWVLVSNTLGSGIFPCLAVGPDDQLYIGYSAAYGYGLKVRKFTNSWENAGDLDDLSGSPLVSSKIVVTPDGTLYAAYIAINNKNKVSVKKLVAGKWQLVGANGFSKADAANLTLAVDNSGTPYVAYQDSVGGAAVVQQFKNGSWSVISPAGLSKGAAKYINLAIAPDQSPYLTFCDAGNANKVAVKKLSGGSWTSVGPDYLSAGEAAFTSIAIAQNGIPYLTYSDSNLGSKTNVKMFTGGQWVDVGIGGVSTEASNTLVVKVSKTGTTYAAFNDALNSGKASVKQYISGTWQYVGSPTLSTSGVVLADLDMDTAPDGTPYVIYRDQSLGSCVVKKYNGTNWVQIGGTIAQYSGIFFKIAIAPDGTPYVAYSDSGYSGQITVQKFSNGSWAYVGKDAFSAGSSNDINIAIDKNNVPYVAYLDNTSKKANAKRFNGTSWETLGAENFTGAVRDINLTIRADGTPYMTFFDIGAGKITVSSFTNNNWQDVGGSTASTSQAMLPKILFNPSGQLYLTFLQPNKLSTYTGQLRKLSQNTWVDAGGEMTPYTGNNNSIAFTPTGDLVYGYINYQAFVRTNTSDDLSAPPVITGISPTFGSTGTVVKITGFNFSSASAIKIGANAAASFTVVSPTVITAVVGTGATGAITVTTPKGNASLGQFKYTTPPPVIKSFSPRFGDVNSIVTINGKNFSATAADNQVYFGAVTGQVTTANDSTLTVKVPTGATAAPITVTVRQLTAYAAGGFNVTFKSKNTFTAATFSNKKDFGNDVVNASAVTVKDMDNDGTPDIVVIGGGIAILGNTSTNDSFSFKTYFNRNQGGQSSETSDLDGDGKPDLVAATSVGVSIYKNSSAPGSASLLASGQYIQPADYPYASCSGDIDGDGRPDLLSLSTNASTIGVFRNSGTTKSYTFFDDPIILTTDSYVLGANLADIDCDGKPDIVAIMTSYTGSNFFGYLAIYKNTSTAGKLSFTRVTFPAILLAGQGSAQPAVADMDNDGKLDVVVPNAEGTVTIFKNTSTGNTISFAAGVSFATALNPNSVCTADLDGDGLPDIATANNGNTISVLKNTSTLGVINFNAKVDYNTNNHPRSIVAADLDGDQAPELIVSNYIGDNNITIFKNNAARFDLPVTNFNISAVSVACKGSANGSINITSVQTFTYTATLTGSSLNKTLPFTTTGTFTNLPAGTYHVCITIAEHLDYEQCYDVVVTEPKDLALYSTVNERNKTLDLALTGGAIYNINLNGNIYTTRSGSINLPLNAGNNKLSVTTDKECQGIIEKLINLSGVISPYPVPFQNTLNVNIGTTLVNNILLQLYNAADGKAVYTSQLTNQAGVLQLDVSNLKSGVYALHLTLDGSEKIFKVIKK